MLRLLHNYRVVVLRLEGVLEVYGGGHEGTSPPEPLTIRHICYHKVSLKHESYSDVFINLII